MVQKTRTSQKILFSLLAGLALIALNLTSARAEVKLQSGNFNVLAESTFDTGTEGWTIYNDGTAPVYYATGGYPGGYIESKDKGLGTYWYWKAPAEFLGDKSAAYGGDLTFFLSQNNITDQREKDDVLLAGGGYTLVYNTNNPGTLWTPYSISLIETAGWINKTTGLTPTQAQMQAVLANLQSIKIRGEYEYGPDTGGLDSVYLKSATFTPTPTLTSTPTATATFTPTNTPTATATNTPLPTAMPSCQGVTCDGWNPMDKGCNNGAITDYRVRYVQSSDYEASGRVENRYSPNCSSQWTRVRSLTVDLIYAEVSIRWGDGAYDIYSEDGFIDSQEDEAVYTNMVDNLSEVLNCGGVSAASMSVTPAPQPIDPNSDYGLENCILTKHMP